MAQDGNGHQVADQLPEGAELVDDDIQEEYNKRQLQILEKIIDKAAADPQWKQKLLSDPNSALDEAGLGTEIDEMNPETPVPAEVTGQRYYRTKWYYYCYYYTRYRSRYFHP